MTDNEARIMERVQHCDQLADAAREGVMSVLDAYSSTLEYIMRNGTQAQRANANTSLIQVEAAKRVLFLWAEE